MQRRKLGELIVPMVIFTIRRTPTSERMAIECAEPAGGNPTDLGQQRKERVMETPYEHQCNYIGDDGKEHSTSPSTLCFACGYEAALQLRPGLERKRIANHEIIENCICNGVISPRALRELAALLEADNER